MDIRPLPGMTLNDLNGLLNDAGPVMKREHWPGRLTVAELRPPIPGYGVRGPQLVEVVEKFVGNETDVMRTTVCLTPLLADIMPNAGAGRAQSIGHQPDEYLETRLLSQPG